MSAAKNKNTKRIISPKGETFKILLLKALPMGGNKWFTVQSLFLTRSNQNSKSKSLRQQAEQI